MDGRSTSRINGETVTMTKLKEVASLLIDIHGQHEHQALMNPARHMDFLDNFGGASHSELKNKISVLSHYLRDKIAHTLKSHLVARFKFECYNTLKALLTNVRELCSLQVLA